MEYKPDSLVVASRVKPVAWFFRITFAFGTAEPEGSVITPLTVALSDCAKALRDMSSRDPKIATHKRTWFI
jgi:hypothetical protein